VRTVIARRPQIQASHPHRDPRELYQVLLLEEFARGGIEVVFAKEPERSGSPEDELLRQLQRILADYERARIAELCRRGNLHRAWAGGVSTRPRPYGPPVRE
jgi:site-specific DNA recombinase